MPGDSYLVFLLGMRIMKKLFWLLFVALVLVAPAMSQTEPDVIDLTRRLNVFLDGASRNDAAIHDEFWAADLIYTGSGGVRRGKVELMKDVSSSPAPKPGDPKTVFTSEDVRIQVYGMAAVVAFRLVGTTTEGNKVTVAKYYNTGTFIKHDGKWQAVAWQATRIPDAKEDAKKEK